MKALFTGFCRLFKHPTFLSLVILFIGIVLTTWNVSTLKTLLLAVTEHYRISKVEKNCVKQNNLYSVSASSDSRPIAWINGQRKNFNYLKHVKNVFSLLGYKVYEGMDKDKVIKFDILWNHEFPFFIPEIRSKIDGMNFGQLVNHVPGSGYYTSKIELATLNLKDGGIPIAFALPKSAKNFLAYSNAHPDILWVQKSNAHRGIKVLPVADLNLTDAGTFVQQFVHNPLLIDGRKFDIGIYTVITSVSPLRVYIYDTDILLRFCSIDYFPFDSNNVDQYVIGDDYTPLWQMPSLKRFYNEMKLSFKESFNAYIRSKYQKEAEELIYAKIRKIIQQVFKVQNDKMQKSLKNFGQKE